MPINLAPRTLQEADQALLELGRAQGRVKAATLVMNEAIAKAKAEGDKKTALDRELIKCLEEGLEECWKENRRSQSRSWKGTFGTFGTRAGKPAVALLRGWKLDRVIEALKKHAWGGGALADQLVRVKEELRKPEITAFAQLNSSDAGGGAARATLALCGLTVKVGKDTFFAEPDEAAIAAAPVNARKEAA